jgi:fluoroquinolone resistance protein
MSIINEKDFFYEQHFLDLKLEVTQLKNKTFENCKFSGCDFTGVTLLSCKFINCDFKFCNLSSVQMSYTSFSETAFDESKLIGIDWNKAKWPFVKIDSPIEFYNTDISYSSFYELDLNGIVIESCKAHEVDFRAGNFSKGRFIATDFLGSLFMHTDLRAASFLEAINYNINPNDNNICKAKFSTPEVLNLLHAFQIEID